MSAGPVIPDLRQTSVRSSRTPSTNTLPPLVVRPSAGNAGAAMTTGRRPASFPAATAAATSSPTWPRKVESIFLYSVRAPRPQASFAAA